MGTFFIFSQVALLLMMVPYERTSHFTNEYSWKVLTCVYRFFSAKPFLPLGLYDTSRDSLRPTSKRAQGWPSPQDNRWQLRQTHHGSEVACQPAQRYYILRTGWLVR